ncbi:DUF3306 domain-containing protein [Shewanella sp. NIFS-20-20]|uniref:DUF3306 domain-containing protein n=1 Tax=Shewanella sp. NIFS-20-20 TaxID=2853806 RepID=UPI001C45A853|nr:DUF3306 domain-containing protein [Shewanella sp. NIFS-20-20]MBV7316060.1 DUF3306 domain-containing protein [Shewanella sp. NIFS-20-20]
MTAEKGLLSRWQLRRQQVAAEAEAEQAQFAQQQASLEAKLEPSSLDDGEVVGEAEVVELPDPEKIEVGGSFASFMADNVDPLAKKAALRALWKQPHFNEIDGLLEYALDYSNQPKLSAEVSEELVNKVFKRVIEREQQELAEQQAREAAQLAEHDDVLEASSGVAEGQDTPAEQEEQALMLNEGNIDNLPEPSTTNDQNVANESLAQTKPVTLG